jgi:hypothetical protein
VEVSTLAQLLVGLWTVAVAVKPVTSETFDPLAVHPVPRSENTQVSGLVPAGRSGGLAVTVPVTFVQVTLPVATVGPAVVEDATVEGAMLVEDADVVGGVVWELGGSADEVGEVGCELVALEVDEQAPSTATSTTAPVATSRFKIRPPPPATLISKASTAVPFSSQGPWSQSGLWAGQVAYRNGRTRAALSVPTLAWLQGH